MHTPAAICRYVLRRADWGLRAAGVVEGLGDPALTVVDPAVGTGAFLGSALVLGARGRLLGIDSDPAAIEAGRAALGDRVEWVVGDALADVPAIGGPVLVVGNPPWVGGWAKGAVERSASDALLEDYRLGADGEPLNERKIGVLSDAYVRFVRWATAVVQGAGQGAFALVTNGSYLDGPVHRGMRAHLWQGFAHLEVTDLGGSALVARDGARDENVFGVRPSVAVTVAATGPERSAAVSYRRLRGTRDEKLRALEENADGAAERVPVRLSPVPPGVFFVPTGRGFPADWVSLPALFPFHREGVQTNRDAVVVDADRERLLGRMQAFALGLRRPDLADAERERSHYDPEVAREAVRAAVTADPEGTTWVRPLAYRPGEPAFFVDLPALCHRPRRALAAAMAHGGWALLSVRKDRGERPWRHVGVSDARADNCFFSSRSSCRTRVFPRFDPAGQPNGAGDAVAVARTMAAALAVLSSSTYQATFDDALKRDYPRLPDLDAEALDVLAPLGESLAEALLASGDEPYAIGHRTALGPARIADLRARCDAWVGAHLDLVP